MEDAPNTTVDLWSYGICAGIVGVLLLVLLVSTIRDKLAAGTLIVSMWEGLQMIVGGFAAMVLLFAALWLVDIIVPLAYIFRLLLLWCVGYLIHQYFQDRRIRRARERSSSE